MNISIAKRYRLTLSAVHMVYRLVNSTYSVKELTLRLTRLLCQFVHASSATVYILSEDKKRFSFAASYDNKINILHDKADILKNLPSNIMDIARGGAVFEKDIVGLPLVTDDYLGALVVRRNNGDVLFNEFDREILGVFAEQAVTAIKNLQFQEQHERIILGSIKSIGQFIQKQSRVGLTHTPAYVQVVRSLAVELKASGELIKSLEYAAFLHDIGAIDVPYKILSKREALSTEELRIVRRHTKASVALIKPVEFLKPILPIILHHHEKYDGTGYPSRLKKEQIPFGARLIAVVDAFEAMVEGRPYKHAVSVSVAIDDIKANRGTQFDPAIVDVFLHLCQTKKFRNLLSLLAH